MSVIISTPEEVQEYFDSKKLGQSKLKLLLGDLASFNKEFDSSAEHFLIGSAVDCILTAGEEHFKSTYYVSQLEKKPSEAVVDIINRVHQEVLTDYVEYVNSVSTLEPTTDWSEEGEEAEESASVVDTFSEFAGELNEYETYILSACEEVGWQPRWGAEAKLKNIIEPGAEYFKDVCNSFGKIILSATQNNTIQSIVLSLKTNPRTKRFFDLEALDLLEGVEVYYQFPIYFEHKGVECKALLDMVVVVRELTGRITSVTGIDLKTMNGNTMNFIHSVKARRYDIQAAWYSLALIDHFALWNNKDVLRPFMFVVESTSFIGKPVTFIASEALLNMGRVGKKAITLVDTNLFDELSTNTVLRQPVLGYEQLLDMYIYHTENGFDEERELKEAGINPLILDWDGIISNNS